MASLQARHSRTCALGKPWTPFERAGEGCSCRGGPTHYVVVREGRKVHRERVGKNRRQAERALTKIQARLDEGEFVPQATIRFAEWGERWLALARAQGDDGGQLPLDRRVRGRALRGEGGAQAASRG